MSFTKLILFGVKWYHWLCKNVCGLLQALKWVNLCMFWIALKRDDERITGTSVSNRSNWRRCTMATRSMSLSRSTNVYFLFVRRRIKTATKWIGYWSEFSPISSISAKSQYISLVHGSVAIPPVRWNFVVLFIRTKTIGNTQNRCKKRTSCCHNIIFGTVSNIFDANWIIFWCQLMIFWCPYIFVCVHILCLNWICRCPKSFIFWKFEWNLYTFHI